MNNLLQIECPDEVLLGLHANAEEMSNLIKRQAVLGLFKEGKISSGMAAKWLGVPRVLFLMDAMAHGSQLLDDSQDDLRRESSL